MMRTLRRVVAMGLLMGGLLFAPNAGMPEERPASADRMWHQLLREAQELGLPTKFLKAVPPSFVRFEFDELHSYAAEYHPGEHRMVLSRALSFNGAGATLRPLGRLTHAQIETLYHELFHAYIDYLVTAAETSPEVASDPVLAFARVQQGCHYGAVLITPVMQRKGDTEERFLTERESWEALNETWAVFVGWIVWNQLELTNGAGRSIQKPGKSQDEWIRRLKNADREGTLRGYYEPEDSGERAVARKRYLAPASRLSELEAMVLMKSVIEFPPNLLARAREALSGLGQAVERYNQCGLGEYVFP
ncbi:MAG TPA: hypothetical protein VK901_18930 [Nitrospiraceae bacterium]|nr:hypothetical protein [Nitrospiraceae bacterium]